MQYSITLNALQNKPAETLKAAKQFFAIAPNNTDVPQMIIDEYSNAGVKDWLPDFFESILKDYATSLDTVQNIYFHYTYSLYLLGKADETTAMAQKAKDAFNKNNSLSPDIENMLDTMANNKS